MAMLGAPCSPCCAKFTPCGCFDAEKLDDIRNIVISLSFSGFSRMQVQRVGVFIGSVANFCDGVYGFPGFDIGPNVGQNTAAENQFLDAWAAYFNSLTADLFLDLDASTNSSLLWRGNTGTLTTPSGASAVHYYAASYSCQTGRLSVYNDDVFVRPGDITPSECLSAPPNATVGIIPFSGPVVETTFIVDCSGVRLPVSTWRSVSASVSCAGQYQDGCLYPSDAESNYYRAAYGTAAQANIALSINPLP